MKIKRNKAGRRFTLFLLLALLALLITSKGFWKFFYPIPYREIIVDEAIRNNVDPYLVAAIIKSESNFSLNAVSKVGARGMMQIMPETGQWAAEQMKLHEFNTGDLYQARTNIKIGCWYLNNLNTQFNGNKILVVAAYNAGRGNVSQWLENKEWSGEPAEVDQIPFKETRLYVKKVLKNYSIYRYLYKE